jgi:hypothetical protein
MEDWYHVSRRDIFKNGGRGLMSRYGNNISRMLIAVYPEHEWLLWKFDSLPKWFFKSPANLKKFFASLEKSLSILSKFTLFYFIFV